VRGQGRGGHARRREKGPGGDRHPAAPAPPAGLPDRCPMRPQKHEDPGASYVQGLPDGIESIRIWGTVMT
jgi:hypothetical protein